MLFGFIFVRCQVLFQSSITASYINKQQYCFFFFLQNAQINIWKQYNSCIFFYSYTDQYCLYIPISRKISSTCSEILQYKGKWSNAACWTLIQKLSSSLRSSGSSNSFKNRAWSSCLFLFFQYLYKATIPTITKTDTSVLMITMRNMFSFLSAPKSSTILSVSSGSKAYNRRNGLFERRVILTNLKLKYCAI